jgi:putative transposase
MPRNRVSYRKMGYDYRSEGWYFITFNVKNFEELLGEIDINGTFHPSVLGQKCIEECLKTQNIRLEDKAKVDLFQIMPNHAHLLVLIGDEDNFYNEANNYLPENQPPPFTSPSKTVGAIIRGIKAAVKSFAIKNEIEFEWQGKYYDRIVRDEMELQRIKKYIEDNPKNWLKDPKRLSKLLSKMNNLAEK